MDESKEKGIKEIRMNSNEKDENLISARHVEKKPFVDNWSYLLKR